MAKNGQTRETKSPQQPTSVRLPPALHLRFQKVMAETPLLKHDILLALISVGLEHVEENPALLLSKHVQVLQAKKEAKTP